MESVQVRVYQASRIYILRNETQILMESYILEETNYLIKKNIRPQTIMLTASQYRKLENIKVLTIEEFAEVLINLIPEIVVKYSLIQGRVKGIQIEWPEGDIKYQDIRYEEVEHNRECISVVEGIMYMLTHKPNWICKGSKDGKFSDRLIMGFDDEKMVVYEGGGATYKILNGLKYYNTQEKLNDIRKKPDVEYICHSSKSKWISTGRRWFLG